MEFIQLKYFQTVARLGNVTKAAQELFVTQPNLSKSIARLEEELGVLLFDHRKGKIALNEYGRIFLSSVDRSFSELNSGIQVIQRLHESSQNVLSLGCSIDDFLPDVLKDFSCLHPEIGIRQFQSRIPDLVARLHGRTMDFAIIPHAVDDDLLHFEQMGKKDLVILVGVGHPLADRKTIFIRELAGERFICDYSRMDADMLRHICNKNGFEPNIAFEVENTNLIYNLLISNSVIAFMPMVELCKLYRNGLNSGIRFLHIKDNIPAAIIGIIYHRDYSFTPAASLLLEFLRKWFEKEDILIEKLCNINEKA